MIKPTPALPPSDDGVLDLSQLEEIRAMPGRKGGSLLAEFVAQFLRDEPSRIAELTRLVGERQNKEIARQAHMLAGSCAILGATELQKAALELQAATRSGPLRDMNANLSQIKAAWTRLHAALGRQGLLPRAGA